MPSWLQSIVGPWLRRDMPYGIGFGLADPRALELFGAAPTAAGISVGASTAMRCSASRCAIQAIAEGCGSLPIIVYERQADGSKSRATDHPAYALVHDFANDWTPSSDFVETATRDALLTGNAYGYVNRVEDSPFEIIRLAPSAMSVTVDDRTGEPVYRISEGSTQRYLDRRDVFHLKAPGLNGIVGESPVQSAREAISLALLLEQHAARLFAKSARPSGVLRFPHKLGGDTAARIKASWQASHGAENAGGTAVLEEGGDWSSTAFTSVDAEFSAVWRHTTTLIAQHFRVPPALLMAMENASYANGEAMNRAFLDHTLRRWLKAWEGAIELALLSPQERRRFFVEFETAALLQADTVGRADAYSKLRGAGVITANEVRAGINLPPHPDGDDLENPYTTSGNAPASSSAGGDA